MSNTREQDSNWYEPIISMTIVIGLIISGIVIGLGTLIGIIGSVLMVVFLRMLPLILFITLVLSLYWSMN